MKISQTISEVTRLASADSTTGSVGTSPAQLFTGQDLKDATVVHIVNTHATQDLYVKWFNRVNKPGTQGGSPQTVTMSSTNYFVKIAAGTDRQFQFDTRSANMKAGIEIWVQGSGSSTTFNAVAMR